jgi:dolichol-phosphate mannosyltransferase
MAERNDLELIEKSTLALLLHIMGKCVEQKNTLIYMDKVSRRMFHGNLNRAKNLCSVREIIDMVEREGRLLEFPSIVVVIAALNEEEGIGPTMAELKEVLENPNYLVVDGYSTDRTVEIAKELGAEVLFQKGQGKGDAISEALQSIESDPEYIVFTDADFTYPAKYVLDMIQILEENPSVGMVTGNRFNDLLTSSAMKNPFYVGNRFLAITQHILNGVHLSDPLTGLRVVRWNILKGWKPKSKGFDIEAELNHRVERCEYQTVEIAIPYRARLGEKKLKLKHGVSILKRIIAESL